MRETGPVSKRLDGDEAAPYMGAARTLLGQLKNSMKFNHLLQGSRSVTLPDGVQIKVRSIFGQDFVDIVAVPATSAQNAPVSVAEQELQTPAERELTAQESESIAAMFDIYAVGDKVLAQLDQHTGAILRSSTPSAVYPVGALAFAKANNSFYAAMSDGTVGVYDRKTLTQQAIVPIPWFDSDLRVMAAEAGDFVYVLVHSDYVVYKVDTATNSIAATFGIGASYPAYVREMAVSDTGGTLVLTIEAYGSDYNAVQVLDAKTGAIRGTVVIGSGATGRAWGIPGLAIVPGGHAAYIGSEVNASLTQNMVVKIDLRGISVAGFFPIDPSDGPIGNVAFNGKVYAGNKNVYSVRRYTAVGTQLASNAAPYPGTNPGSAAIAVMPETDITFLYAGGTPYMYRFSAGAWAPAFSTPFHTVSTDTGARVVVVEKARFAVPHTTYS